MDIKKVVIIEGNREQGQLLADYLKKRNLDVTLLDKIDNLQEARKLLGRERFNLLLLDIVPQEDSAMFAMKEVQKIDAEFCFSLTKTLKNTPQFQDLLVVVLTSKGDVKEITQAIKAGADNIIVQGPPAGDISKDLIAFFDKITLREKKALDLNLINFLLQLSSQAIREDFFVLVQAIFDHLLLDKIRPIIGEPVINSIMQRLESLVAPEYSFMAKVRFQEGRISMEEIDRASKEVSMQHLTFAFRDYIYAFIHMVRTLTSDVLVERWDEERK